MDRKGIIETLLTILALFSLGGFIFGFAIFMTYPAIVHAFYVIHASPWGLLHVVSQVFFAVLFLVSIYLIIRNRKKS
jgi:uncharacterized protein YqhQ